MLKVRFTINKKFRNYYRRGDKDRWVPSYMATENVQKIGEVRSCGFWDMLITILCTSVSLKAGSRYSFEVCSSVSRPKVGVDMRLVVWLLDGAVSRRHRWRERVAWTVSTNCRRGPRGRPVRTARHPRHQLQTRSLTRHNNQLSACV